MQSIITQDYFRMVWITRIKNRTQRVRNLRLKDGIWLLTKQYGVI